MSSIRLVEETDLNSESMQLEINFFHLLNKCSYFQRQEPHSNLSTTLRVDEQVDIEIDDWIGVYPMNNLVRLHYTFYFNVKSLLSKFLQEFNRVDTILLSIRPINNESIASSLDIGWVDFRIHTLTIDFSQDTARKS